MGVLLLLPLSIFASSNTVVNLSHYDMMRPDFVRMRGEGVVGILHEATYPRNVRDARYAARQHDALSAGMLWGAYHFADATDPVRQADHFLSAIASAWRGASPPTGTAGVLMVLDFEKNGHYPGGTMRVDQAVAFVERIHQRTGKYPGIYSNEYRVRGVLNGRGVSAEQRRTLSRCWLWVANYHYQPRALAPWSGWDMWQYTGDGVCDLPRNSFPRSVANIRKAERNMFRGSAVELKSFWQENAWVPQ